MKFLIPLLCSLFLIACNSEVHKVPQGPTGSWWLGGDDGGAFIDIKDDGNVNDRIYFGTVYYDADREVWYRGPFRLVGSLNFDVNNHNQYLGWDGERLYLKESSYLEPINPVPAL
jgi:hypothetical protein